jgi:phosphatidylserine decarboxylase
MDSKKFHKTQRLGLWLPRDRGVIAQWVRDKIKEAEKSKDLALNPKVAEFQQFVNGNQVLQTLANEMFSEIPNIPEYQNDPVGHKSLENFDQFIAVLNLILQQGPQFYDISDPSTAMGLIGFPINAALDWPMGTTAGYTFWLLKEVNAAFQPVLNYWGAFLASSASLSCLDEKSGWLSPDAQSILLNHAEDPTATFQQVFLCDQTAPYFGFKSWDDFFTRQFQPGLRPIGAPDHATDPSIPDPTLVIDNACESAPLQVVTNVKYNDTFWVKTQPYSLNNMLNFNTLASQFTGGTVYQAFLSALSYHRWHAPVSGKVLATEIVPGTYYSENYFQGIVNPDGADPSAANLSQPFISAVATRGIIYIEATNSAIGLMAIVFVGMAEVSSCEFLVSPGDTITKGQQIGMFHFGGSTHCMVFRPGVKLQFVDPPPWDMNTEANLKVCSPLAVVISS